VAQDTLETSRYDKGNRYEGVAVPLQAGDLSLEIVSFTAYLDSFRPNTSLKVKFFLPSGESEANIFAQELTIEKQYFMKSKQAANRWAGNSWNLFSPWPTKDVLDKQGVPPSNIGVLVERASQNGIRRFAPAFLCSDNCPSTFEGYRLMLRPGRRIVEIQYTISNTSGDKITLRTIPIADTLDPTPIPVNLPPADLPAGELTIALSAKVKNRDQFEPPITFSFCHRMAK